MFIHSEAFQSVLLNQTLFFFDLITLLLGFWMLAQLSCFIMLPEYICFMIISWPPWSWNMEHEELKSNYDTSFLLANFKRHHLYLKSFFVM
jgi:hypothetical protein